MANDILLEIKGLHASVGDKEILKGIDLTIRKGEIHAVMGPNGAGKSTLSSVLTGKPLLREASHLWARICWRCLLRSVLGPVFSCRSSIR